MKAIQELPVMEKAILKSIPVGATHPKNTSELASELGLTIRGLRSCIRRLVVKYGIPVIATRRGGGGYFIPRNQDEMDLGILPLLSQHEEEQKRITALLNADLEAYQQYLGKEVEE